MAINIKVGFGNLLDQSVYSHIELNAYLTKDKIQAEIEAVRARAGFQSLPNLLVELPNSIEEVSTDFETLKKDLASSGLEASLHNAGSKIFVSAKMKQNAEMIKGIENTFKDITKTTENKLNAKISLANSNEWIDRIKKGHPAPFVVLEGARFELNLATDPKLPQELEKIFTKVCPEFNDSPVMVALRLLESIDIQFGTYSFRQISEKVWKKFEENASSFEPTDMLIKQLIACNEDVFVYVTLPELACLKLKAPGKVLGLLLQLLK